jgi:hypothetical protein
MLIALVLTVTILGFQISRLARSPALFPAPDFAMYWATARLNAVGANPYDRDNLLLLERAGRSDLDKPVIMYSPPWMITLLLPFGILNYGIARLLWLLLNFAIVALCAKWIWRLYGVPSRFHWIALVLSFTFLPTLWMLSTGQTGSLVLLGIVGFLSFERRGQDISAGAMLAITAIKPHLVYLLWLAVLLEVLSRRRWGLVLGGVLVIIFASIPPLATNPSVFQQYQEALRNQPPLDWITPTLGTLLRFIFGADRKWLQFVPSFLAILWFFFYWFKKRDHWNWLQQTPLLVLTSLLTTFYGAWSHDYVIGLLPILQAAAWTLDSHRSATRIIASGLYLLMGTLLLSLEWNYYHQEFWLIWLSPSLLVSYLIVRKLAIPAYQLQVGQATPKW